MSDRLSKTEIERVCRLASEAGMKFQLVRHVKRFNLMNVLTVSHEDRAILIVNGGSKSEVLSHACQILLRRNPEWASRVTPKSA